MKINKNKKIGILGGSFDPSHRGHIKISLEAKKKFKINKVIWVVTKKNPIKLTFNNILKNKAVDSLVVGINNEKQLMENLSFFK